MQTQNRFLDFAEQVIARHNGFGYAYEPMNMIFLEDGEQAGQEQTAPRQSIVNNLYHIQNIREENYLYQQNLNFLTQILEKRFYQTLYPSVEQQIEKAVREEMPEAEEKIVKSFSQQMYKLVERGGIQQFETIRECILSEYREKEKEVSKEQEVLFRKIENIWNSSVYADTHRHLHQTNVQLTAPQTNVYQTNIQATQGQPGQTALHSPENILEHAVTLMQRQERVFQPAVRLEYAEEISAQAENVQAQLQQQVKERELEAVRERERIHEQELIRERERIRKQELIRERKRIHEQELILEETRQHMQELVHDQAKVHERELIREQEKLRGQASDSQAQSLVEPKILQNIAQNTTNSIVQNIAQNIAQNMVPPTQLEKKAKPTMYVQSALHLEYPTEETMQLNQEILKMVHQEFSHVPEVPEAAKQMPHGNVDHQEESQASYAGTGYQTGQQTGVQTPAAKALAAQTLVQNISLPERSRTIAEQILFRVEQGMSGGAGTGAGSMGTAHVSQASGLGRSTSAARTVAYQQLSQAVMEYAQERTTAEELQKSMTDILHTYQQNLVRQTNQTTDIILEKTNNGTVIFRSAEKPQRILQKNPATVGTAAMGTAATEYAAMEPAAMVFRSEEDLSSRQAEKTNQLEQQVKEVVKNLKTVEEKTIVQKEAIIEQQKTVVREVLKNNPTVWTEGDGASYIRKEVQQTIEEQLTQNVNQIVNKVYRRLEDKLKTERGRRGLI